jgi:predicted nucleic acid-binding protein
VIVVDAGVLATALADDGLVGTAVGNRLGGEVLATPELIGLEVAAVFRKLVRTNHLESVRAGQALDGTASAGSSSSPHRSPEDPTDDRLHLILGE